MDIFVLPSYSEGFSNSLLEAMACGCAVVGSRVGGTSELIGEHEERGLLFRSNDVDELSNRLAQLIRNDELRCMLGNSAAKYASTNLTIGVAAETTASIYERLMVRYCPA